MAGDPLGDHVHLRPLVQVNCDTAAASQAAPVELEPVRRTAAGQRSLGDDDICRRQERISVAHSMRVDEWMASSCHWLSPLRS
jgi:hypothetical protein